MTDIRYPILKNAEDGHVIHIYTSPFSVGRGLTSNYVIESRVVSRTHCIFEKHEEGWKLRDVSTNGTLVNEEHVRQTTSGVLKHTDVITLFQQGYVYKFLTGPEDGDRNVVKLQGVADSGVGVDTDGACAKALRQNNAKSKEKRDKDGNTKTGESNKVCVDDAFDCNVISDEDLCLMADSVLNEVDAEEEEELTIKTKVQSVHNLHDTKTEPYPIELANSIIPRNTSNPEPSSGNVQYHTRIVTSTDQTQGNYGVQMPTTEIETQHGTCCDKETARESENSKKKAKIDTLDRPGTFKVPFPLQFPPDNVPTTSNFQPVHSCFNENGKTVNGGNTAGPTVPSLGQNVFAASSRNTGTVEGGFETVSDKNESRAAGASKQDVDNSENDDTEADSDADSAAKVKDQCNQYEEMENELLCAICSELFIKAVTLTCSHTFCKYCIQTWKKKKSVCPICRTKITNVTPTLVLDNVILKVVESSSDEIKQQRKKMLEERAKLEKPPEPVKTSPVARRGRFRGRGGNQGTRNQWEADYGYGGDVRPVTRATAALTLPPPAPITISSDSDSETDSEYDDWQDQYDEDDWYDGYNSYSSRYPYYGGYGSCFNCGETGHWANGCPYR